MTTIFNGRAFAAIMAEKLKKRIDVLLEKGIQPRMTSVVIGGDPASHMYADLKMKKANELGARVHIFGIATEWDDSKIEENKKEILIRLKKRIGEFVEHGEHGTMIQLPLPAPLQDLTDEIINLIPRKMDVDGLREDSLFLHPTSKAVVEILEEALRSRIGVRDDMLNVAVVGATGMVGTPLVKELSEMGFEVDGLSSKSDNFLERVKAADIVISTTGVPGIIKGEMVKDGAIVIDVGAPNGDVEFESVSEKASFITPVPGGVGPVTVMCLLENLVEAAYTRAS